MLGALCQVSRAERACPEKAERWPGKSFPTSPKPRSGPTCTHQDNPTTVARFLLEIDNFPFPSCDNFREFDFDCPCWYQARLSMPKITSFAPSWLNEPSPAHKLFEQPSDDAGIPAALQYGRKSRPGPRRTIARRGTEVFVAVGKQIRWGDLAYLRESWETKHARSGSGTRIKRESSDSPDYDDGNADDGTEGYRVSWAHRARHNARYPAYY